MANFTKKAIKTAFLELLEQRPMSQITVKNVVERCGVNRNSFYYHFRDLPSLVEEIVIETADKIIAQYDTIASLEECLDATVEFALAHRRAALHIYNSVSRDLFDQYLMKICEHVVSTYLQTVVGGRTVEPRVLAALLRFYKCECFGQIIDWMGSGMREDPRPDFHLICELRKGFAEQTLYTAIEQGDA